MEDITAKLKELFGDRVKEHEPMAKHSTYRVGGEADWFVEARSVEDVIGATRVARDAGVPMVVIGGGTNVLFSDEGFRGIVLQMALRKVEINGSNVVAEAGALTALTARQSAEAGLEGFEWGASLPGTMGGAVRGNAGCFGGEMKDNVSMVEVLRDGEVVQLTNADLQFGYRDSILKHNGDIVLRVELALHPGDSEILKARVAELVEKRNASQPLSAGSAGCAFKNYNLKSDEELARVQAVADLPGQMQADRRIATGWLIDQLGLKGKMLGDAKISEKHGNFILNRGHATAQNIFDLIQEIKSAVREKFGIELEEEIQLIGFSN
ncbi:MAG: UDP-N-acetylmuramate dehydrogenase [Patescibacteria group bacterium]